MDWTSQNIQVGGRYFEVRIRKGPLLSLESAYRAGLADAISNGDGWFVYRTKDLKSPTGEFLNGVPLYRYQSSPNELWHIRSCSLNDSIEIAGQHLGCPDLKHCLHGKRSRMAISTFLENQRLVSRAKLSVVSEVGLTFELIPSAAPLTRSEAQSAMDVCLTQFKKGSSAREREMLVQSAVETGVFTIGSV